MSAFDLQDLEVVVTSPTTSKAHVDQDVEIVVTSPTTSKAHVAEDLQIAVTKPTTSKANVAQEIILVIVSRASSPSNALLCGVYADYQRRPKRNPLTSFTVDSYHQESTRRRPIVFCVS